ncbi:MAG: hypothetical protein ACLFV7_00200 [Phycisphaerae bacterium]
MTPRHATGTIALVAALLLTAGGCIPSERLEQGQMDRLYTLAANPADEAELSPPSVADRRLPAKWTIRHEPSLIVSTISLVRAMDALREQEPIEVDFGLSPRYTETLVELMGQARTTLDELHGLTEVAQPASRDEWASGVASALSRVEELTRTATQATSPDGRRSGEPLGMPASPMMQMLTSYLQDQTGGELLDELDPNQAGALRTMLAQVVLKLGFAVIGKQMPDGIRSKVVESMRSADDLKKLEQSLQETVVGASRNASPGAEEQQLRSTVRSALVAANMGLQVMQEFMRQWDRLEYVSFELRKREGESVVVCTVKTQPKKTIRIAGLVIAQPTMVFRGQTQIVVFTDRQTDETVLLFEPLGEGGGVELHFEGIVYTLARVLAFPLDNARLREIRTLVKTAEMDRRLIHVSVRMESLSTDRDARRMMVFQDARRKRFRRDAFDIRTTDVRSLQVLNYITPEKRYSFRRLSRAQP